MYVYVYVHVHIYIYMWGVLRLGGALSAVPKIRIIVHWGLYDGPSRGEITISTFIEIMSELCSVRVKRFFLRLLFQFHVLLEAFEVVNYLLTTVRHGPNLICVTSSEGRNRASQHITSSPWSEAKFRSEFPKFEVACPAGAGAPNRGAPVNMNFSGSYRECRHVYGLGCLRD